MAYCHYHYVLNPKIRCVLDIIFDLFIQRYLVDCHWLKQWKKFVGFDTWDQYGLGAELNNPGPIDNSSLLEGKA